MCARAGRRVRGRALGFHIQIRVDAVMDSGPATSDSS